MSSIDIRTIMNQHIYKQKNERTKERTNEWKNNAWTNNQKTNSFKAPFLHLSFEVMIAGPKAINAFWFFPQTPRVSRASRVSRVSRASRVSRVSRVLEDLSWAATLATCFVEEAASTSWIIVRWCVYYMCHIVTSFWQELCQTKIIGVPHSYSLGWENSAWDLLLQLLRLEELAVQPCWWRVKLGCGRFPKWMDRDKSCALYGEILINQSVLYVEFVHLSLIRQARQPLCATVGPPSCASATCQAYDSSWFENDLRYLAVTLGFDTARRLLSEVQFS